MKIIDDLLLQLPFATIRMVGKTYTVSTPREKLRQTAVLLKSNDKLSFDFLMDIVGMDYMDSLGVVYYLSSTQFPTYIIVLKTYTNDRENPQIDSICDLW